MALSEEEYAAVRAAAERVGMAVSAYAGTATVAMARRVDPPQWSPLTELMGEVMRAAGQARRIGINLNQAVAALHSSGHPTHALEQYARVAATSTQNIDELAEEIRRALHRFNASRLR
ncbi:hypothetical protein E1298_36175 [Actinomadura rubrisoli]|uniref:MobC family plasmid mobilization relaxosome protein n=1 Tax=Actinomadura rubrisoli TaxID=2530368 RepID=A0A4R5AID1_9ACTN|nr:hypothetical protein [Actinomadura rubrisoli]TDD71119.1 hypothetical protein E1298_36175 [Actinomadura rubrisoli]